MYAAIGESDRANMSSVDAYINARFFYHSPIIVLEWERKPYSSHKWSAEIDFRWKR